MNPPKITVQATINTDIKKAWEFYTKPEYIVNWNFASDDWHCPSASNDLRVGGQYSARMEAKDGSFGFDYETIYTQISVYEKLVYVMLDERVVEISFSQKNDKIEVVIVFDAEMENYVELQKDGWQAILNNYKNYVETN